MYEDDSDPNMVRLVALYPLLFRGLLPRCSSQLANGWFELVENLCRDIELVFGREGCDAFTCHQVKEKFGTLRFYWSHGESRDSYVDLIAIDGTVTEMASRCELDSQRDRVRDLVDAAVFASGVICEMCGRPGRLIRDGWHRTRCNKHAAPDDSSET